MSWWMDEQGLLERFPELIPDERLVAVDRYWRAVGEGWEPPVPRERWHPYHPWDPVD